MKIILSAVENELVTAWQTFCGDLPDVEIYHGSILDLSVDAIVSPANSYGFMDGGIDLLYSHRFGWQVQKRLQQLIREKHHGELLIGQADIVETDNLQIPFVISAPTMRVPMILKDSVNPYLAARAVFLLIKYGTFFDGNYKGELINKFVNSVAFPGLATGIGRIGFNTCAKQMQKAIEDVVLEKQTFPLSWVDASAKHQELYTDKIRNLQYE
ncbi:MAG TPA: macro domain-containing protein [Pyrinomonadaceae bacterium]|nr:macro domain-containing protein [Pyrinomonadaceae bacterium]